MNNDIVTRLRAVFHNDKSVELMNREAADEIERLRKSGNILETLIAACLYEGISGVLRSDGTTDLVDGGCGCCSDRPKHLTEEQKALIADILKRNKK